jgi:5'-methylthioadenosine phosphorylase
LSNDINVAARIGIIAGTGFESALAGDGTDKIIETPYGEAIVTVFRWDEGEIIFLPRHGAGHTLPPHKINHQANIWALHSLNVKFIMATAACGSLRLDHNPGDIVFIDDFIDFRGLITTYFDGVGSRVTHTDFSEPVSGLVRRAFINSIDEFDLISSTPVNVHKKGTYLCVPGPRYETPAEVRLFGSWGADVVGMTVAPEAILAKELRMSYSAIAVVTNLGTGLSENILRHDDVGAQMEKSRQLLVNILRRAAFRLFDRIDS